MCYKEQTDVGGDDVAGPMYAGWQGCKPRCFPRFFSVEKDKNGNQPAYVEITKTLAFFCAYIYHHVDINAKKSIII